MMAYDLLKKFIPVSSCLKKRENGNFLIVLNEAGELFYLNNSARFIYTAFDTKRNIGDIFNLMKAEYEAASKEDEDILKHDIIEILRDFQHQKIVYLMEV